MVEVQEANYDKYDGLCGDGQHRTIALMFVRFKDVTATYQPVKLSKENMDILAYISIRNNGRKWLNYDFYASNISTGDTNADYILNKGKKAIFLHSFSNVSTTGTSKIHNYKSSQSNKDIRNSLTLVKFNYIDNRRTIISGIRI